MERRTERGRCGSKSFTGANLKEEEDVLYHDIGYAATQIKRRNTRLALWSIFGACRLEQKTGIKENHERAVTVGQVSFIDFRDYKNILTPATREIFIKTR